jgi:hypothetical protein
MPPKKSKRPGGAQGGRSTKAAKSPHEERQDPQVAVVGVGGAGDVHRNNPVDATAMPTPTRLGKVAASTTTTTFSLRTGAQPRGTSIPGVVEVGKENSSTCTSNATPSRDWFEACRKSGRMGCDSMLSSDLVAYVRNDLFPKLKFIMDAKQLNFSTEMSSICYRICTEMGLVEPWASQWWEQYKKKILETLNNKRADVTATVKRAFLSKWHAGCVGV